MRPAVSSTAAPLFNDCLPAEPQVRLLAAALRGWWVNCPACALWQDSLHELGLIFNQHIDVASVSFRTLSNNYLTIQLLNL